MRNFAVAVTDETHEEAERIMKDYQMEGDKKEDTLKRILAVAKRDKMKGTHPEHLHYLSGLDEIVSALYKNVEAMIAVFDLKEQDLIEKVKDMELEKNNALDQAKASEKIMKQVKEDAKASVDEAKNELEKIKSDAEKSVNFAILTKTAAEKDAETAKKLAAEAEKNVSLISAQNVELQKELKNNEELESNNIELAKCNVELNTKIQILEMEQIQVKEKNKYFSLNIERLESELFAVKSELARYQDVEKEKLVIEEELKHKNSELDRVKFELEIMEKKYSDAISNDAKHQEELHNAMCKNMEITEKAVNRERELLGEICNLEAMILNLKAETKMTKS